MIIEVGAVDAVISTKGCRDGSDVVNVGKGVPSIGLSHIWLNGSHAHVKSANLHESI